jgi:hypothetical protein
MRHEFSPRSTAAIFGNIEAEHQASEEREPRVLKFVYCTVEWRSNHFMVRDRQPRMTQDDLERRRFTHRVDPDFKEAFWVAITEISGALFYVPEKTCSEA